jgi:DNA (cytosine-5)-methyltransferase 1
MTHGSLFSGLGGFDLASDWMGWETVFQCEYDKDCQAILQKNFRINILYGDIKTADFKRWLGAVDVISGGDPCQPSSVAGSRKGKSDIRYLWPQYLRCIRECGPTWIVNENVTGTISNGILDQKISDLEALGYACWPPLVIPAGAVGALHIRDRVWLVAYSDERRQQKRLLPSFGYEQIKGQKSDHSGLFAPEWSQGENKSAILRMAHGSAAGLDMRKRIKAAGNAVMPQIVYQIFKAIEAFENQQ